MDNQKTLMKSISQVRGYSLKMMAEAAKMRARNMVAEGYVKVKR